MNPARTRPVVLAALAVLTVTVAPWVVILATIPAGEQNFPLIDDWAFHRGACAFCRGEGIDYQHWASMPLLGQWLWACPFLGALGESHVATRASTVVLSWLGLWAFHDLLRRQEGTPAPVALFATACLAWNPYYFLLSGTFMSDVPALAFSLIALALYARALDAGRFLMLATATVFALLAVATRQSAVAAPLTAAAMLIRSRHRARPLWPAAVAVPIVATFVTHSWLQRRPDVVPLHARWPDPSHVTWLLFTSALYVGLMTLPLLALLPLRRPGRVFWGSFACMTAGAIGVALIGEQPGHGGIFPYLDDVLTARGPYFKMEGERPPLLPWSVWFVPTALACVCAAALIARGAAAVREVGVHPLVIFSALQLGELVGSPKLYDRYLLPLVVGALAVAARASSPPRWRIGLVALVLLGSLSVCLMHDWLSLNAARWDLGHRAEVDGIKPGDVQGGMEWDHFYPRTGAAHYRLSLSPSPPAVVVDAQPYRLWLPPRSGNVYLLRLRP
jgi:hypothetical protein